MSPRSENAPALERVQKVLFYALAGLLVAFSAWCVTLLWSAHELRRDLDRQLESVEDVRRLRAELDRLGSGDADEAAGEAAAGRLERIVERLADEAGEAELEVAVASLRRALERLRDSLADAGSSDAVWDASVSARSAVATLEGRAQSRLFELYRRLGGHWTALYALIVASLLLAASNLALLHVAHRRRRHLEQAHLEALRQSTLDPLTRSWNREAILKLLRRELVRAARLESPLGVILADLDGFHQINLLLGEDQGDFILEQLAARLATFVRPYDTMGRLGGDSFLIVLPVCDLTATGNVAERLREAINGRDMEHALGRIRVTVSIACATVEAAEEADADLLIHRLQERLASHQAEGPGRLVKVTS